MRFRRNLNLLAAGATIIIGFAILEGCLYIPLHVITGHDAANKFGYVKGKRPFAVGLATREQIMHAIGNPDFATPDRSQIYYSWKALNGFLFAPLCNEIGEDSDAYTIGLHFNGAGVLDDFHVFSGGIESLPRIVNFNRSLMNQTFARRQRLQSFIGRKAKPCPTTAPTSSTN